MCCCDVCGIGKIEKDLVEVKVEGEPVLMCLKCYVEYKGWKKNEVE